MQEPVRITLPASPKESLLKQPLRLVNRSESSLKLPLQLLNPLRDELPASAYRIYSTLHHIALVVAGKRGYAPSVSCVTFHLPTELLAFELGISRTTLWTHVKKLKELGLVDQRGHTTTYEGRSVKDGSVWSVKLHPKRGKSARLSHDDLKHHWRDLGSDIGRGRTVYNWIEQSKTQEDYQGAIEVLIYWALSPGYLQTPLNMTVQPSPTSGPEVLLDVPYASRKDGERNAMVNLAARSIASYLGDDSVNFYRYLLWQLLRLHDRGQDYFHVVYDMLRRAGADRQEGFARSAGALFVARLKKGGLWELLQDTPHFRVGGLPS